MKKAATRTRAWLFRREQTQNAASTKPKSLTTVGVTKYKYNEGFTNALRRTVYMKDLFPGMVEEEEEGEKEEKEVIME